MLLPSGEKLGLLSPRLIAPSAKRISARLVVPILDASQITCLSAVPRSVQKLARAFSSGFSIIVTQQAAQSCSTTDRATRWKLGEVRSNDLVVQPLVVALRVIMRAELRNGSPQGRLTQQDHLFQTGLFDAANESFREGIQVRRTSRQSQRLDAAAFEDGAESFGEQSRTIMDQ